MLCTVVFLFVCATMQYAPFADAAYCNEQANITGPPNEHPVDVSAPVFVRSVPNGELYTVGTQGKDFSYLIHLYGNNGYDFGYAHGQLLAHEINQTFTTAWAFFVDKFERKVNKTLPFNISEQLAEWIATVGLEAALDHQNELSAPFMDPEIYAEMRGISDASSVPYDMIRRIHMVAELTRGDCSYYGAWGNATLGNRVLQLRALDSYTEAGLQNNPLVAVYHPSNPAMGYPFVNVGWAGWIGTVTGMSSHRTGISEIGIAFPNYPPYFGNETYAGIPFIFLERKIIQYGTGIADAIAMIESANRTCHLILGVADGNANTATLVQYSSTEVNFYDDQNLEPLAWWHPRIDNVVYAGMDWYCPFYQHSLATQMQLYHGQLTPEISIRNVTAAVMTGDLHVAVYDLTDNMIYVANHAPSWDNSSYQNAYQRQFFRLNVTTLVTKEFGAE